ncbi:MAG: hypothetical protein ACOCZE_11620 [Planctomycetota bacterium]
MYALIVDPNPVSRELLLSMLTESDWHCEALDHPDRIQSETNQVDGPDLVVLALDSPVCNPVEIIHSIRSNQVLVDRSVLLLAEADHPNLHEKISGTQADGLLTRPLVPELVQMHLDAVQRRGAIQVELQEIYKAVPMSLILLDGEGMVIRTNPAARTLGNNVQVPGKDFGHGAVLNCVNAVHSTDGCGQGPNCNSCLLRELVLQSLADGLPRFRREAGMTLVRPDRLEHLFLLVTVMPLLGTESKMVLLCLEDISHARQAQRKLERSVAELEAFNEIAIDREMRMIELKQQVNDLAVQAGLEIQYDLSFAALNTGESLSLEASGSPVGRGSVDA